MDEEVSIEDVMRVLVATDNHLGYCEKDPVRGPDSFIAFEEILELAVSEDVDFILLGGDLFHDSVPSQNTLHKCMQLLRRYTFGDKPVPLEFLSDQTVNFHNAVDDTVNYEDPNLNVSIPVFSIHGNHDDPSGFGGLSSLDLLATTGLVNYFGRWTDLTKVVINPILLRKGKTQLALYGLSHIHDARLVRLFQNYKVTIECPNPEEGEWFNLFVLHQNHADRGPKNFLPEEVLPDFLHLVIWGHEHDCQIEPQFNGKKNFYVSQPGSSVATSLAEGETLKKHVGLLEIHKTRFQLKPLPLQTVRPFVFESLDLSQLTSELESGDISTKVMELAKERVEEMIERSKSLLTGHPKQPTIPLIRLRILFTSEDQMFNAIRFGQAYNERVANPADVITFKKLIKKAKNEYVELDEEAMKNAFENVNMNVEDEVHIEDIVERYFEETETKRPLNLMTPKVLSEICNRLVEKRDTNAADTIIQFYKENAIDHLMDTMPAEDKIAEELQRFKQKISHDDILKMLDERGAKPKTKPVSKSKSSTSNKQIASDDDDDDDDELLVLAAAKAKTSTRSAKPKTTTVSKSRSSTSTKQIISDDDDDDELLVLAATKAETSTRGRKAATANKSNDTSTTTTGRGRGRGGGRGSRGGRTMPKLDVSITSTRSSLMDQIAKVRAQRGAKKSSPVIDISDSE